MKTATMDLPILTCGKFLGLLDEFYRDLPDAPTIDAVLVPPDEIPQPQHDLLVHHCDMTSTLGRHHGEPIGIEVMDYHLAGNWYSRHIILRTAHTRHPVEYGAIRVFLPLLNEPARDDLLRGQTPMGTILVERGLAFRSCPGAYFKIYSNPLINGALRLARSQWLFGRCNCLVDGQGRELADVIEILPPQSQLASTLCHPTRHLSHDLGK